MNSIEKIVFIRAAAKLLIMEISPYTEMINFLNGLLMNLTLKHDKSEQPIKTTLDDRKRAVEFLKRKYPKVKVFNRLIKFFEDLTNEEYIYLPI